LRFPQFQERNTTQASPGKFDRLPRTPAGSTALALDGSGLRDQSPARPAKDASYPVSVRQVAVLLHTAFRPHLAMTPLCFANPSPPSGWIGDFHPQAIEHAGHTTNPLRGRVEKQSRLFANGSLAPSGMGETSEAIGLRSQRRSRKSLFRFSLPSHDRSLCCPVSRA
jgi:hypothetical protein